MFSALRPNRPGHCYISHTVAIVRDRKGNWLQALKESLGKSAGELDQDLTAQHGDRYLKVKQIFKGLANRVRAAQSEARQTNCTDEAPSQPISIEVLNDDMPPNHAVRSIESEEA